MGQFWLYVKLGIQHIADIYSVDNILFLLALTVILLLKDWKKALIMVTIFTLCHSLTLTLGILQVFKYNIKLIQYLIPTTIFITAILNILRKKDNFSLHKNVARNYLLSGIFGLLHGLGYAGDLRAIMINEKSIFKPVFAFNVGIELGQIIVVGIFLIISTIFIGTFNFSRRDWVMVISSAIAGIALTLMFESKFW